MKKIGLAAFALAASLSGAAPGQASDPGMELGLPEKMPDKLPGLATVNRATCHNLTPILSGVANNVAPLVELLGNPKQFDPMVLEFPDSSAERKALARFRDELNNTGAALEALRKAARDAAYVMDVCDKG